MKSNVGNNIKLFRNRLKITQYELSDYCGIPRELISYYETGAREISLLHLEKIAEFLNVELEIFIGEYPQSPNVDLALAFRADELAASDWEHISHFKRIVKNYLKMKNISANGIKA